MEVVKWLGGQPPKPVESVEEALESIERWAGRRSADGRFGIWAVEVAATGVVAGTVLLVPMALTGEQHPRLPEDGGDVEVGWHFHPDSWGQGYATESARGAVAKGLRRGARGDRRGGAARQRPVGCRDPAARHGADRPHRPVVRVVDGLVQAPSTSLIRR